MQIGGRWGIYREGMGDLAIRVGFADRTLLAKRWVKVPQPPGAFLRDPFAKVRRRLGL